MMTEDELDKAESYWTSQEKDAKKMPAEVLREKAEAFLTSHNTCALACGAGDFVRCTPLEYVWRDGPSGSSPKADSSSTPSARICV
jgi:nitroimidazol reductase NimA-like FMN-containing flavoprotein (pyridoxamine 5'-phosphate oxidase superfamily)